MNYRGRFAAHCGLPTGVGGRLAGMEAGIAFFIWRWASSPYRIGGIMPSARPLARAMACASMEARRGEGPVVELGGGTGSITQALIERGIGEQELILIERDREMCRWLKRRFPRAAVVRGEAAQIDVILAREFAGPASVVVSSLPLRNIQANIVSARRSSKRASMRCLKAEHLCSTPMRGIRTSHVHGWVSSAVRPGSRR